MTTNPKIISVKDSRQDIAFIFDQYELTSAPVVDQRGRLVGMITIDDVVDLIREKADEDILKLGGVSGEGDLYLAAFKTARSRFGWLGINLITAIITDVFLQNLFFLHVWICIYLGCVQVHLPRISYKSIVISLLAIRPSTSVFLPAGRILIRVLEANLYLALFL